MKIYVYAICKNEEKFVSSFMESALESDGVFVLDTGSRDGTIAKLRELGATVHQKIYDSFRFDVARNDSLSLVPEDADLVVCFDLDEVFNIGWRKILEEQYQKGMNKIQYVYNWKVDENNHPLVSFYYEKIHTLKDCKWVYPVHEVLQYTGEIKSQLIKEIILTHHPDPHKSRSSYLKLLELSVKENPHSDRNMHYLGREYLYHGMYAKALRTLKKHIMMKEAQWNDEKAASYRFIARIYQKRRDYVTSKLYYKAAIEVAPYLRDAYIELALLEDFLKEYSDVVYYVEEALKIKEHPMSYINEPFSFSDLPYDLLSVAYFYLNEKEASLSNIKKAIVMNPNSKRLQENYISILNGLNT